jgi:hypothetical protein
MKKPTPILTGIPYTNLWITLNFLNKISLGSVWHA